MIRLAGACSLLVFACAISPSAALAEDFQANEQCPPGGQVGQKCKDTTNGYVTDGHCTHINVCKADSWNKNPPKGCGSSGNIYAPTGDCPKGPNIPNGTPTSPSPGIQPQTPTSTQQSGSPISADLFEQAYSHPEPAVEEDDTVSTSTIDGIMYFITGDEKLPEGAPLTPEPVRVPRTGIGEVVGLVPVEDDTAERAHAPSGAYAQSPASFGPIPGAAAPPPGFSGYASAFGSRVTELIAQGFRYLRGSAGADTHNTFFADSIVIIVPPVSLFEQRDHETSPFMTPDWQKIAAARGLALPQSAGSFGGLFLGAAQDLGRAGTALLHADISRATREAQNALRKSGYALSLVIARATDAMRSLTKSI